MRAAQDRALADDSKLFAAAAGWQAVGTQTVRVAPRRVGDPGRVATVRLSAGRVEVRAPRNGRRLADAPEALR